jgi:hypothetical protein
MYQDLPDLVDQLTTKAVSIVYEYDRIYYQPIWQCVETFAANPANGVIVGENRSRDIVLGNVDPRTLIQYDIYVENPNSAARQLANNIYTALINAENGFDERLIYVETNIRDIQLSIWVNCRICVIIHAIEFYRGVKLTKLIDPVDAVGYFGEKLTIMGPTIMLIGLYKSLYNPYPPSPVKYDKYETLLAIEAPLWDAFKKQVNQIHGGVSANNIIDTNDVVGGASRTQDDILRRFIYNNDRAIVIGTLAMNARKIPTVINRMQILLMTQNFDADIATLRQIVGPKVKLHAQKYDLKLPNDIQLIKWTIYDQSVAAQVPIMDIYNAPNYEIVTCAKIGPMYVGTKYVLARFKLVDFYAARLIYNMNPSPAINKLIHSIYDELSAIMPTNVASEEIIYVGNYINEHIVRKKIMRANTPMPKYFPARTHQSDN